jgi:hypothetical protein
MLGQAEFLGARCKPSVPAGGRGLRGVKIESGLASALDANGKAKRVAKGGKALVLAALNAKGCGNHAEHLGFGWPVVGRAPFANGKRAE